MAVSFTEPNRFREHAPRGLQAPSKETSAPQNEDLLLLSLNLLNLNMKGTERTRSCTAGRIASRLLGAPGLCAGSLSCEPNSQPVTTQISKCYT